MITYRFSDLRDEVDVQAVHHFLNQCYWAEGIPLDTLTKALDHSLCFSVFATDATKAVGRELQVGFARVITDKATFAYLADVYLLPEHRGQGLSKQLMSRVLEHSALQGLRRMLLATRDAHRLYAQFGFKALANADSIMENWQPDVYRR